jgi:hypothetical protein
VKLAISLDMVGYSSADSIMFYDFVSEKGSSPIWTRALGRQLLGDSGLKEYTFTDDLKENSLFISYFKMRTSRSVPTDSGPFVDRGIASLGLIALDSGAKGTNEETGVIHDNRDVIEQVSSSTLELFGRFAERYIKSVETGNLLGGIYSRNPIALSDGYIPGAVVDAVILLVLLLLLIPVIMDFRDLKKSGSGLASLIRRETPTVFAIVFSCIITTTGLYLIISASMYENDLERIFIIIWYLVHILLAVLILLYRRDRLRRINIQVSQGNESQRVVLSVLIYVWLLIGVLFINPFTAFLAISPMIFIFSRASFKMKYSRVLWRILFILSYIPFGYAAFNTMMPYLIIGWGFKVYLVAFWIVSLWLITCVYIMGSPGIKSGRRVQAEPIQDTAAL